MSRILLVGASGFVGRAVAAELDLNEEHEVIKASNSSEAGMVLMDATSYEDVYKTISKYKPEVIVNCAGVIQNNERAKDNISISMTLLRAAAKAEHTSRFVMTGSAAEYGEVKSLPVPETAQTNPVSVYGASKAQESADAIEFGKQNQIEVVVARLFNPLGEGMSDRLLVSSLLSQLAVTTEGPAAIEVSRLDSFRDYIDIRDVAKAYTLLVNTKNLQHSVYNIGSGIKTSTADLIRILVKLLDVQAPPSVTEASSKPESLVAVQADISRITTELGWKPEYSLEITLGEIVNNG